MAAQQGQGGGIEQRRYVRVPINLEGLIGLHGRAPVPCTVRDFCAGGMFISADPAAYDRGCRRPMVRGITMRARSQILLMTASALCCRVCVAVTPGAHLPGQDEVRRFISGRGVTIGMLGDSLSFPLSGSPGVVGASHVNMGIGFIRRFQFHEGHRALFMPPGTQHLYSGLSGVWFGSSNSTPSIEFSDSIGAKDGSIVPTDPDDMAEIQTGRRVRFLQPSPNVVYGNVGLQNLGGPAGVGMPVTFTSTPAAEALLAAPRLEFRVWVTESPTGPLPSVLGIDVVDQNLTTIVGSRTAALSTEPPGDWRKGGSDGPDPQARRCLVGRRGHRHFRLCGR